MSQSVTFCMRCPECDDDIDDIEASIHIGSRRENFWGASVSVDESECEIESIPDCLTCKKQTISEDAASEYYWYNVYG